MAHLKTGFAVALALVALAGCSKKPPEVLPPSPSETPAPPPSGDAGPGYTPGSQEDFIANTQGDTIYFDTDKYDVGDEDRVILDSQAAWLRQHSTVRVTIEGHADERGTRDYNIALGARRANAAKDYLASAGIPVSRISTISYGKERPKALGSDESAWAQNRRAVTVTVQY